MNGLYSKITTFVSLVKLVRRYLYTPYYNRAYHEQLRLDAKAYKNQHLLDINFSYLEASGKYHVVYKDVVVGSYDPVNEMLSLNGNKIRKLS